MRRATAFLVLMLLLPSLLAGCSSTPAVSTATPLPTATASATFTPAAPALSFVPATYRDQANGFEFDYPLDWSVDSQAQSGSRGSVVQLYSPGTTAEKLGPGGSRLSVTIFKWDPQNDLAAYVAQRRGAWANSGLTVLDQWSGSLGDGRLEDEFVLQSPEGVHTFFLFTTNGPDYLQLAGEGDTSLLAEIAHTTRPLTVK